MLDLVAPGTGAVLGGLTGLIGTSMTNAANAKQAAATNAFNAQQAQIARDFAAQQQLASINAQYNGQAAAAQTNENMMYAAHRLNMEGVANAQDFARDMAQRQTNTQWDMFHESQNFMRDMSNTAYQRSVADMRAAGINPMLAYMQGGASTPSSSGGSGATGSAPAATATPVGVGGVGGASASASAATGSRALVQDMLKPAFSAAMQGANFALGLEQLAANIEKTRTETELTRAHIYSEAERPDLLRTQTSNLMQNTQLQGAQIDTERRRPGLVAAQTQHAGAAASSAAAQANLTGQQADRFSRSGDSWIGNTTDSALRGSLRILERLRELIQ